MRPIGTQLAPNIKVNFILPLSDGSPHFKEFMQMFEQVNTVDILILVNLLVLRLYFIIYFIYNKWLGYLYFFHHFKRSDKYITSQYIQISQPT